MLKPKDHFHGSDLEKIEEEFHIKKEDIISFSANVNPLGISPLLRQTLAKRLDAITTYPDREYTALRKSIGRYAKTDFQNIIVGNGSTELISLFIQIEHPKKALIVGPTYSEYEREISLGGGTSLYFPLQESEDFMLNWDELKMQLNEQIDLLVICNPNNPTGTAITQKEMRKILDCCKQHDIFVMIDETYVEFALQSDKITSIPLTESYNNLIILRGISKFFAAPGLRLGYAITGDADLLKAMNTRKNPWTINSLAEIAGTLMFADTDYIEQTRSLIARERDKTVKRLGSFSSVKVYPPTANFVLFQILNDKVTSEEVFTHAILQHMMVRDCSTFPFLDNKYVRFCFLDAKSNERLLSCLAKLLA